MRGGGSDLTANERLDGMQEFRLTVKNAVSRITKSCSNIKNSSLTSFSQNDGKITAYTLAETATQVATASKFRKVAFTLAEVLITLGIIGVVAAMTMPMLIGNYKKQQATEQVKKAYSVIGQAFNRAIADYGDSNEWDEISSTTAENYYQTYWKPYFQGETRCFDYKQCGYNQLMPFFKSNKNNDGYNVSPDVGGNNSRMLFSLPDGTFIMIITGSGYSANDRRILVDLNGPKLPNRFGNDVFFFLRVPGKGVLPYGYDQTETVINRDCSIRGDGYMCAAKLMQAGWKMDDSYPF